MRQVLDFIRNRQQAQETNPFIRWLADEAVPVKTRLAAWFPCAALFAFGFKDLNSLILRYPEEEAARDPLKRAINRHTHEDSRHWGWYLHDLRVLGVDGELMLSDALKLLWGKRTQVQREATYKICQLADRATDPVLRYCLVMSIEVFGNYLFKKLTDLSSAFHAESGQELRYLGPTHFEAEVGSLANQQDDVEKELWGVTLNDETRKRALEIAHATCELIERRWIEFAEYAALEQARATALPGTIVETLDDAHA